jgi:hypothetical protein
VSGRPPRVTGCRHAGKAHWDSIAKVPGAMPRLNSKQESREHYSRNDNNQSPKELTPETSGISTVTQAMNDVYHNIRLRPQS